MNKSLGRGDVSDNLSFTTATSEATGKDKRTIERAAARGEALGSDIDAVAGTSLDKGVEPDVLALWVDATKRKPGEGQARDPETGRMLPKLDNIQDRDLPDRPTGNSAAAVLSAVAKSFTRSL